MRNVLHGSYTYLEFAACMVAWLPILSVAHVLHLGDAVPRVEGRWLRRFGRTTTRLSGLWRFSIEGEPPPDIATRPYVVVANHESTADPFLLSFVPWDMRWVAKAELFRVPLTGWLLGLGGDIPVRRGDASSVREMMDECRRTLEAGLSVMLFPEGTRSRDGALQRFKDGAFQLAIDAQVPVLPIALDGTRDCRPKGSAWFGRARAKARILAPIETRGMRANDVASLRDLARARIAAGKEALLS
jgi:1-acyl-sn-glycerol-3-phosphate acyltransferase